MITAVPTRRFRTALVRVARDAEYRAHVIEDGRAAQFEGDLTDAQWHSLLPAALACDSACCRDPFISTELDHGEADAAGVKN